MPPMSGWGMGVDRFVALLTDQENLREVVLFPLLKPIEKEGDTDTIAPEYRDLLGHARRRRRRSRASPPSGPARSSTST